MKSLRARLPGPLGLTAVVGVGGCLGVLALPTLSAAKPSAVKYIRGHLNMAGYTVVAVGYNGKIASSRAQAFKIPAPGPAVTVQLISPQGKYAGPVVFGGTSSRVITGVKAGTSLGMIDVVAAKGYAHLAHSLPRKDLDSSRWAYATHGVPIGTGRNLGLIRGFKGKKNGGTGPGQDEAYVGIPNEFDIAVPGTNVIKELAPAQKARGASAAFGSIAGATVPGIGQWASSLGGVIDETVNADAAGVTTAEINEEMKEHLSISTTLNANADASLVELDCNGLSYCSYPNSTGEVGLNVLTTPSPTIYSAFPDESLDLVTHFGELVGPAVPNNGLISPIPGGGNAFFLFPRATSTQIGSGDVIITKTTVGGETVGTSVVGGETTDTQQTLGFVFETTPAITSYSDTAGDSGTITYPDTTGLGGGSPEHPANAIKVAAGPNGDVVLTLTFYRPQRPGVEGAGEAPFMDIGHLGYALLPIERGKPPSTVPCNPTDFSNLSPTLSLSTASLPGAANACVLVDSASDQPATAGSRNTLSFTVDLTQYLAARGLPFPISTPSEPHQVSIALVANVLNSSGTSFSDTTQLFTLQRTS